MNTTSRRLNKYRYSTSISRDYNNSDNEDFNTKRDLMIKECQFYQNVPNFEISLDEFEESALDRLKVLRKIEELKKNNIHGQEFKEIINNCICNNLSSVDSTRQVTTCHRRLYYAKRDIASHFILRAAYCKTEDLQKWYLQHESYLLQHRLMNLMDYDRNGNTMKLWLERNSLTYELVSHDDKLKLWNFFFSCILDTDEKREFNHTSYYKVPFTQAFDLISKRQCYLYQGYVYVPYPKLLTIIVAKFRSHVSKSLFKASYIFRNYIEKDKRLKPLLETINQQGILHVYHGESGNQIRVNFNHHTVNDHVQYMPLCMYNIHSGLKMNHHLKYHGRMQYSLFLKGAGLSMEQCLIFFQNEFTKIIKMDKFNKEYAYYIRHIYGKEGKRQSKSSYSCMKIIMGQPPSIGQYHGCPYKHYDDAHLNKLLCKIQIGNHRERQEILDLKRKKHYTLACQKHFDVVHPNAKSNIGVDLSGVGIHPNAWFLASTSYHKKDKKVLNNKN